MTVAYSISLCVILRFFNSAFPVFPRFFLYLHNANLLQNSFLLTNTFSLGVSTAIPLPTPPVSLREMQTSWRRVSQIWFLVEYVTSAEKPLYLIVLRLSQ